MSLCIIDQAADELLAYGLIPAAFPATHRWNGGPVEPPFIKDYDALPGNRPVDWPCRFNLAGWRFAAANLSQARIGGVAIALVGSEVHADANPQDAVLWDIRVHPDYRHRGVGRELLQWAEKTACSAARARLLIETQDINFAACALYSANGYICGRVEPFAYPDLPGEAQIVWAKVL